MRIHRVHLEEDAAKLVHAGGRIHGSQTSIVDFNRGGTPLVEIVTEPDLRSADDGRVRPARATLRQMGVSDAQMEEGSLRADANVSIRPAGEATFGTKTELKNMNSWTFLRRGIEAEIERQEGLVEARRWCRRPCTSTPERHPLAAARREEAHDYRYFPEPDLVPLAPSEEMVERAGPRSRLPAQRAERFERELGLSQNRAPAGAPFRARRLLRAGALGRRWCGGRQDDRQLGQERPHPRVGDSGRTSGRSSRRRWRGWWRWWGRRPCRSRRPRRCSTRWWRRAATRRRSSTPRLGAAGGAELAEVVDRALAANPEVVEKLKADPGSRAVGAIVGAVMKETKGRADGGEVQRLIRERIG